VLHRFPYSALNFTTFEKSRELLVNKFNYRENGAVRFVCGAVAGTVACVGCYPLDLLRTRLSILEVRAHVLAFCALVTVIICSVTDICLWQSTGRHIQQFQSHNTKRRDLWAL
jgi:hypothetical protein